MIDNPQRVAERLRELQRLIRDAVLASRDQSAAELSTVTRVSAADTIYGIDATVEPIIEDYCAHWGRETPLVVIAEGIDPETGATFPHGTPIESAALRILVDPIDGTRGIMYDKRPAWALACAAPNQKNGTRYRFSLSDAQVAVMTELPTSKMGWGDVLWAIKGRGAHGVRESLTGGPDRPLQIRPSAAASLAHGFASVSNFFPATKVLASELMEHLVEHTIGKVDATKAQVFDDQYISTGGQFYELIVGHDRFNADLRPFFYRIQNQHGGGGGGGGGGEGLCCHPYDCAGLLIAQEAGIHITDGLGRPLDAPMDTTTNVTWAGFANAAIRSKIEPLLTAFLQSRGITPG